jgi:hypothetical protein
VRVTTIYPGPVNTWGAESREGLLHVRDVVAAISYIVGVDKHVEIRELTLGAIF